MSLDIEPEHPHPHKTGHGWTDKVVAFSALFVSVVSLCVAILHGRTMETMADANAKLVSANSWPYLSYLPPDKLVDGVATIEMNVSNQGVGPAKIESAELIWKGKAYRSQWEFLQACCGLKPDFDPKGGTRFSLLTDQVIRAGDTIQFLGFKAFVDPAVYAALNRARLSRDLHLNVCYCSIFDECWKDDLTRQNLKPPHVAACVQPKVPFDMGVTLLQR